MFDFGVGEIALLVSAAGLSAGVYISPAKRATKRMIYIGSACAVVGVITGYTLVGFGLYIAAIAAGVVVQGPRR